MFRIVAVVALAASALIACGDDPDVSDSTLFPVPSLEWSNCGPRVECATLDVPFDYANPEIGTFELPVARHLAQPDQRIGVLVTNPGGPGVSGLWLAESATTVFSPDIVKSFDIVSFDPRGVGDSAPHIDCGDTGLDYFVLDPSPDNDEETNALLNGAHDYVQQCLDLSGVFLSYVGTEGTVTDIDTLRRALGEDEISYIGFSYGTLLGAMWAAKYPETVRVSVLDGPVDVRASYLEGLIRQAAGFEHALDRFFEFCNEAGCGFMHDGESAEKAFDRIAATIENSPLPTNGHSPATAGVFSIGVAHALYSSSSWPGLADALTAADQGDGGGLLTQFDQYFGVVDGRIFDTIDAYFGIVCADRGQSNTPEEVLATRSTLAEAAPRIGTSWVQEMLICANWPVMTQTVRRVRADTAVPTLIVASLHDSATPLDGARNLLEDIGDARFVTVNRDNHTSYMSSSCAANIVDAYLLHPHDELLATECA